MKIDNTGKPLGTTPTRGDTRPSSSKSASAAPDTAAPRSDSVEINTFSARLQSLQASLANQPPIDEAKVAEIRQAITEGRFKINPNAVADGLMKSVKELLGDKE